MCFLEEGNKSFPRTLHLHGLPELLNVATRGAFLRKEPDPDRAQPEGRRGSKLYRLDLWCRHPPCGWDCRLVGRTSKIMDIK